MLELGMALPGLSGRAAAIGALPALGLLTLAGMMPERWTVSYHEAAAVTDGLVQEIVGRRPTLVGISALTASILEAYALAARLRAEGIAVVIGGLHATACPHEAAGFAASVVVGDGEPVWPQVLATESRWVLIRTHNWYWGYAGEVAYFGSAGGWNAGILYGRDLSELHVGMSLLYPVALTLIPAALLWYADRRRRGPGSCGGCGYDRAGLAVGVKCPECGTVPASAPG
jgi:hypothetical protein